jgi:NAD(P)H-nitrite reductase large subunit
MENEPVLPPDEVMCHCSGTKRGYIQSLYQQGMDIQAISRWTGALSGCGGCEWDIADFLKEIAEKSKTGL